MTRVLGLDLSLTATGVCSLYDGAPPFPELRTVATKPSGTTLADRRLRLQVIVDRTTSPPALDDVALVVVEGPSLGSHQAHTWDRAGLWWLVVSRVRDAGVPIVEVPPTTLKKFATGKGIADKTAVAAAMARIWPEATAASDNEWDALTLAHIGAQHLGMNVPSRAHHTAALAKIVWPDTTMETR